MEGRLHRRVLVPVLALAVAAVGLGALAVGGSLPMGDLVGAKPRLSPTAGASASASPEACKPKFRRFPDDASRATWFTLDGQTDANGVLIGNVVRVGRVGGGPVVALELPPEAWAAGPYDEGALVGSDDGLTSTVRFLAPRGCGRTLLTTPDAIVWRATISPDGLDLYTYELERGTRYELGLWVAPIADPTQRRQLLGPIPADDRFGRSWGIDLSWSAEGDRMVVESCTPTGCRYRIVSVADGTHTFIDDEDLGEFVGLVGDRLFLLGDCPDFRPCALLERNLTTGATTTLHAAIDDVWLVRVEEREQLVARVFEGAVQQLHVIDPERGQSRVLALPAQVAGLAPVRHNDIGAVALPRGWLALAADGEVPRPNSARKMYAIDVETSRLLLLLGGDA
jgi:hypothetical protein